MALDGVTLTVPRTGVFGLLGPNGAGKTTLLRIALGLVAPTAGSVELFGEPVARGRAELHRVGAAVDRPAFYPHLSARENLEIVGRLRALPANELAREVPQWLDRLGLSEVARRPMGGLSTGMHQRAAIAAALLGSPALVVLDEPTDGLDPRGVVEVRTLLHSVAEAGNCVLLSSHMLGEVEHICDRFALLHQGRLILDGPLGEVLAPTEIVVLGFAPESDVALARRHLLELGYALAPIPGGAVAGPASLAVKASLPEQLVRDLTGRGVYPRSVVPARRSLEDLFLERTNGRSLH